MMALPRGHGQRKVLPLPPVYLPPNLPSIGLGPPKSDLKRYKTARRAIASAPRAIQEAVSSHRAVKLQSEAILCYSDLQKATPGPQQIKELYKQKQNFLKKSCFELWSPLELDFGPSWASSGRPFGAQEVSKTAQESSKRPARAPQEHLISIRCWRRSKGRSVCHCSFFRAGR